MFVEKLWEEQPDLVVKAIKKVWDIREERGDTLEFIKIREGEIIFQKHARYSYYEHSIIIRDFEVYANKVNNSYEPKWVKFMYKVYGDKYAIQYISHRNKQLDKFMAEYEEKYNKETRKVLDDMGFQASKGLTK